MRPPTGASPVHRKVRIVIIRQSSMPKAVAPRPAIVPISSEALPHIAGKRITTVRVDFPPRGRSPKHHHGGSVSVYVLSGTIRSQLEGGPVGTYTVGDMFSSLPAHVLAENVSATEAATILAVFVHDEGRGDRLYAGVPSGPAPS
jgi:quercetin dioxygenase-like cupin family protein